MLHKQGVRFYCIVWIGLVWHVKKTHSHKGIYTFHIGRFRFLTFFFLKKNTVIYIVLAEQQKKLSGSVQLNGGLYDYIELSYPEKPS